MSARSSSRRSARVAAVVAVLLCALAGWWVYDHTLAESGWHPTPGPLDAVHVIDKAAPVDSRPAAVLERLDRVTGARWDIQLFQDRGPAFGGVGYAPSVQKLRSVVGLPDDPSVLGVATNLFDDASVQVNGAAYIVWFDRPSRARAWLMTTPRAFVDAGLEKRSATYLIGPYVAFYAAGGQDRSKAVARTFREAVRCPYDSGPCPT